MSPAPFIFLNSLYSLQVYFALYLNFNYFQPFCGVVGWCRTVALTRLKLGPQAHAIKRGEHPLCAGLCLCSTGA